MELLIFFRGEAEELPVGETLEVTKVGENVFRLEHTPLFQESLHYRDVVELARRDEESWWFVRVVEPSGWRHTMGIFSKSFIEAEPFQLWLESVIERGGFWEVAFGGCVFVSWPPNSPLDADAELQELLSRTRTG